jgi:outer membrane protein
MDKFGRSPRRLALAGALCGWLLGGALAPSAAAADSKPLGVIDSQRIVEEYDAARDAQEQYQKFLRDLEKEVDDKGKELQRMFEEMESQKMLLDEDALATKNQEFQTKRDEYLQLQQQADSRAQQEYKTRIGPIIDQVRTIAERLGKEEGFGLIIDASGLTVLYLDNSVDLTDKVLAALVSGQP